MENLSGRGFGATCCACVSFAREIVRDSPMVNFHSQTMNAPWSSAAKSMLPGNTKSHVPCNITLIKRKFYAYDLMVGDTSVVFSQMNLPCQCSTGKKIWRNPFVNLLNEIF